jgi:hypothetical protein
VPETGDDAYIALAREIRAEVDRIAADPGAHGELLAEVFERANHEERARLAREVFAALEPQQQWAVIERVFGDAEIHEYLDDERAWHLAVAKARAAHAIDTRAVPADEVLVLGLFCERDVRAALTRGCRSTAAARRLALRSLGDGTFQVLHDVFNPDGGYFITSEYSEETWRRDERLDSHARVALGSIANGAFEPVLYAGGRVDAQIAGDDVRGQLYLGFAKLGEVDVFVPERSME